MIHLTDRDAQILREMKRIVFRFAQDQVNTREASEEQKIHGLLATDLDAPATFAQRSTADVQVWVKDPVGKVLVKTNPVRTVTGVTYDPSMTRPTGTYVILKSDGNEFIVDYASCDEYSDQL